MLLIEFIELIARILFVHLDSIESNINKWLFLDLK